MDICNITYMHNVVNYFADKLRIFWGGSPETNQPIRSARERDLAYGLAESAKAKACVRQPRRVCCHIARRLHPGSAPDNPLR